MTIRGRLLLAFLSTILMTMLVVSQSLVVPDRFRKIDADLIALSSGNSAPSVAVAVAHRGRIVWEAGYGFSDTDRSIKTTPQTPFAVGSVAKTVVATTLMRLVERGIIDLDQPIHKYLPGEVRVMQGDSARLTPGVLASMTGGIPHLSRHYRTGDVGTAHNAEALVREFGMSMFPPGASFHYSNMSFGVLERLLEKITGKSFSTVVEDEVFGPLHMRNSFFATPGTTRSYAVRLTASGASVQDYVFTEPEGGAGLVSSAHDLALFGSFHAGHPINATSILSTESLERMRRPVRAEWTYGLGMWSTGYSLVFDGAVLGGAGIVRVIPSEELAVAVVTNAVTDNSPTYAFVGPLVDAALAGVGRTAVPWEPSEFFNNHPFIMTPATAGRWTGAIHHPEHTIPISLIVEGDSILVSLNGAVTARVDAPVIGAGMIRLSFSGNLEIGSQESILTARLFHNGDILSGYVSGQSDRRGLAWPRYVELTREH